MHSRAAVNALSHGLRPGHHILSLWSLFFTWLAFFQKRKREPAKAIRVTGGVAPACLPRSPRDLIQRAAPSSPFFLTRLALVSPPPRPAARVRAGPRGSRSASGAERTVFSPPLSKFCTSLSAVKKTIRRVNLTLRLVYLIEMSRPLLEQDDDCTQESFSHTAGWKLSF